MKKILRLFLVGAFTALFIAPAMAEVGIVGDFWDDMVEGAKKVADKAYDAGNYVIGQVKDNKVVRGGVAVATGGASEMLYTAKDMKDAETTEDMWKAFGNGAVGMATGGMYTAGKQGYEVYEEKKIEQQKKQLEAQRQHNEDSAKTVQAALQAKGKCIHVNDKAVEAMVKAAVKLYAGNKVDVINNMMATFYEGYTVDTDRPEICVDTVLKMCKIMLGGAYKDDDADAIKKCLYLKNIIAYTAQYPKQCRNGAKSGCIRDYKYFQGTAADGFAVVEFWNYVKNNGKEIYCAHKDIDEQNNQDYLKCKLIDGTNLIPLEFEFNDLKESFLETGRSSIIKAAMPIGWPGKDYDIKEEDMWDIKYANMKSVSEEECNKYDEQLKYIFGGKSVFNGKSCSVWFQDENSSGFTETSNAFGIPATIFSELQIQNNPEVRDFLEMFVKHRADMIGARYDSVKCALVAANSNTLEQGLLDEPETRYWKLNKAFNATYKEHLTCFIKNLKYTGENGKLVEKEEAVVKFVFKDTAEAVKYRSNVGLQGFRCVTKAGGVFDGVSCSGIEESKCREYEKGGKLSELGKVHWDDELKTCVMDGADDLKTMDIVAEKIKDYSMAAVGVALAVVAAIPSGGGSVVLVIATITSTAGAAAATTGYGMKEAAKYKAANLASEVTAFAGQDFVKCKNGDMGACLSCIQGPLMVMGSGVADLLDQGKLNALENEMSQCVVLLKDDDPKLIGAVQEKMKEYGDRIDYIDTLDTWGGQLEFWGGLAAFAGGTAKTMVEGIQAATNVKQVADVAKPTGKISSFVGKVKSKVNTIMEKTKTKDVVNTYKNAKNVKGSFESFTGNVDKYSSALAKFIQEIK